MKPCDLAKVPIILELFQVASGQRDDAWIEKFFANVVDASFRCETPQIFTGPDGFPYFSLLSPEPLQPFDSFCISNLVEAATDDGYGIALNRRADGVDWVFSYGDLLTLRLTGSLEIAKKPAADEIDGKVVVPDNEPVLIGSPAETFLPAYAKAVIRRFMEESLGVAKPGMFLMSRPNDPRPEQLVFSIFPEQYGSEAEFMGVLQKFSWFLPRRYSVTGISQTSELCRHFIPL
jgi:hypothetical protein